jgi:hypothetical protein
VCVCCVRAVLNKASSLRDRLFKIKIKVIIREIGLVTCLPQKVVKKILSQRFFFVNTKMSQNQNVVNLEEILN